MQSNNNSTINKNDNNNKQTITDFSYVRWRERERQTNIEKAESHTKILFEQNMKLLHFEWYLI